LLRFGRSDIVQHFDRCVSWNGGAAEVHKWGLVLETVRQKRGWMSRQSAQRMIVLELPATAFRGNRSHSRKKGSYN
jgi:hypothetical protein